MEVLLGLLHDFNSALKASREKLHYCSGSVVPECCVLFRIKRLYIFIITYSLDFTGAVYYRKLKSIEKYK